MVDNESMLHVAIQNLVAEIRITNDRVEKTNDKVDKLSEGMAKLIAIDTEMRENNKRVHHRIDEISKRVDHIDNVQNTVGCTVFREAQAETHLLRIQLKEDKEEIQTRLTNIENIPKDIKGYFLKGFIGALGTGFLAWIMWSISHFGIK